MKSQFRPGTRVLCINDDFSGRMEEVVRFGMKLPVKGTTYTVRSLDPEGLPGILLVEIVNPLVLYSSGIWEPIFLMKRFEVMEEDRIDDEWEYDCAEVTVEGDLDQHLFKPCFTAYKNSKP